MGVQGLWVLLEPVGRRVNIEALTNKCLAVGEASCESVNSAFNSCCQLSYGASLWLEARLRGGFPADASIWVHQFLKTMRAANGDVLRNAHILGFFRRICRQVCNPGDIARSVCSPASMEP